MSYLTIEVEIDHGKIVPSEPAKLPVHGKGLLTIVDTTFPVSGLHPTPRSEPRPIGLAKGEFVVPDDFNAPLPPEVLGGFEAE